MTYSELDRSDSGDSRSGRLCQVAKFRKDLRMSGLGVRGDRYSLFDGNSIDYINRSSIVSILIPDNRF
jgi:hypothetical protein